MKLYISPEREKIIEDKAKQSFDELPVGEYTLHIEEISEIPEDRGFSFKFNVLEPANFMNRKIWKNIYLRNKEGDVAKEDTMLGMFSNFLEQCGIIQEIRSELYAKLRSETGLSCADLMKLFDGRVLTVKTVNNAVKNKEGVLTGDVRTEIKKVLDVKNDGKGF